MPAITPVDVSVLPVLEESSGSARRVQSIVTAQASFEARASPCTGRSRSREPNRVRPTRS